MMTIKVQHSFILYYNFVGSGINWNKNVWCLIPYLVDMFSSNKNLLRIKIYIERCHAISYVNDNLKKSILVCQRTTEHWCQCSRC